jgi:hypothetical protein
MQIPLPEAQTAALDASGYASSATSRPTSEPCETALPEWVSTALGLLGVYAVVRAALLLADVLSAHILYGLNLSGPLLAWDAHWYIQIANHGYPLRPTVASGHLTYNAANFLPFFPALIRAVETVGLSPAVAAFFVSVIGGAVATLLVWRLGIAAFDEHTGRVAAVLFAVFPGMGIAWGLLYSECVGLTLAAGCLLMLCKKHWLWAGLLGMCATLTSPMAVVPLTVAAIAVAFQSWRRRAGSGPLIAVFLIPAGFFAYAGWIGYRYHDALFYWHLGHEVWGTSVDFGRSLLTVLIHPLQQGYLGPGWINWLGLLAVAGAVAAMVKARLPAVLTVYCSAVFVQLLVTDVLGFRPRNLTWAFPALIAVAATTRRRGWVPLAIGFALVLPVVFLAYTTIGNTMGAP